MNHGTLSAFAGGCRCERCVSVKRDQAGRAGRASTHFDRKAIAEVLDELFPFGLTDDCPARRGQR